MFTKKLVIWEKLKLRGLWYFCLIFQSWIEIKFIVFFNDFTCIYRWWRKMDDKRLAWQLDSSLTASWQHCFLPATNCHFFRNFFLGILRKKWQKIGYFSAAFLQRQEFFQFFLFRFFRVSRLNFQWLFAAENNI